MVLAFYPADFTKGCTAEMQTFADQYDTLFGPDVVVLGISADSLETPSVASRPAWTCRSGS